MKKLRTAYLLAILLPAMVSVILLSVITLFEFKKNTQEINISSAELMRSRQLDLYQSRAKTLAFFHAEELVNPLYFRDLETIDRTISASKTIQGLEQIVVFDADRKIVHDGTEELFTVGTLIDDSVSLETMETGNPIIHTSVDSLSVAVPVLLGDTMLGGVKMKFSLAQLNKDIEKLFSEVSDISLKGRNKTISYIILILALLSLSSIFLAVFFARRLTQPIETLSEIASRIGKGEYGLEIPVQRSDEIGNLAQSVSTMQEQVRTRTEELTKSKNALSTLMSNLPGMAYRCQNDENWTMEFVSEGCFGLTGYDSNEMINNQKVAFASLIHPDDQSRVWNKVQTALKENRPFQLNYRIRTKKGEEKWVLEQGRGTPTSENGNMVLEGFITDITVQKLAEDQIQKLNKELENRVIQRTKELSESQARIQTVMDVGLDGIITINEKGVIETVNPACKKIFDFKSEELIGQNVRVLMPELFHTERNEYVPNNLSTEKEKIIGVGRREVLGRRKDGSEFPLEIGIAETKKGGEKLCIGILRDITERKKAEEEILQAKEQAEEATQLKDKFISLVSHDLRAPINTILGFLGFLDDNSNPLNESQKEIYQLIVKSSKNMVKMIERLLDISRLHTGKVELQWSFEDAQMISYMVIESLKYIAEEKGIKLVNEISPGTRLYLDTELFMQVIQNLVTNAIKFSHPGGKVVLYTPQNRPSTLAVQDWGVGISEEALPKLFRYEEKTSTVGTSGETGTGLGLPFCKEIIESHGGTISIESEKDQGSTFFIELPHVRPLVLVVEDSREDQFILHHILKGLNVEIVDAENGHEALKILNEKTPHLIITDVQMPVLDGIGLLESVRKDPKTKDIPVIMVTSDTSMETRERAVRLGANDFNTKPLQSYDFIPRVKKFIG